MPSTDFVKIQPVFTDPDNPTVPTIGLERRITLAEFLVEAGAGGETSVAWADVTGKPTTFPPVIGATATTAMAGNTALLVLGTTATTAKAGDYTPPNASATVKGLVNAAATQAASVATDAAGIVTDFNALLAKLKTAGIVL